MKKLYLEVTDSINYARLIQQAILPATSFINKHLEDSFFLYLPKAIVAGDFYWFAVKNDLIFVAAADCTGHGVPGAMGSVVCSNALNRAIFEMDINTLGQILDKTRELVIETYTAGNIYDGMDISLCSINILTYEIEWSGANNPLWYTSNNELHEIKGH